MRRKLERMDVVTSAEFKELQRAQVETIKDFRGKWLFNFRSLKEVMKKARSLCEDNDFCNFLFRMKLQFFNAGFEIYSSEKPKAAERFLENAPDYPFADLARDVWVDYLKCSNVVAFWVSRDKAPDAQKVNGIPLVTILNAEEVDYSNEFGVESVKIRLKKRTLTAKEREALGPRYAKAIENGELLELDKKEGENWKVLTNEKLGNGFGMPVWKAALDDLAARDLLKIGDWNGAWARKHLVRHGKKGHLIKDGPLAGMPEYFYNPKFGKKILQALQGAAGFMELMTNFDLQFDYVFLDPKFFDPAIYKGIEDRLAKWAGACLLMLREGNPNPNLSKMFKTEGESERSIVGRFLEGIINDPTFQPESLPKGMQRLHVRWDPWVFFDAEQLRQMITFGLQNGVMSPQLAQRAMGVDGREHKALMGEAHKDSEQFTPVFEAKQGMASGEAGNSGGDAGKTGGRPPGK